MGFGLNLGERKQLLTDMIKQSSSLKVFDLDATKFQQRVGCYLCLENVPGQFKMIYEIRSRTEGWYPVCPRCYSDCKGETSLAA
jgi:hypothetical protein